MRRTKGFTLVELLVVIAIIALLMGILMPALARVRAIAFRMTCGTNLAGIGKAMLIYANDYQDEFPIGGWASSVWTWGLTGDAWKQSTRDLAFGVAPGRATITSSLYALVKYADVPPKLFICKSDTGVAEFDPRTFLTPTEKNFEVTDAWDFGPCAGGDTPTAGVTNPDWRCSYSYQDPFCTYLLTTASDPGMPVAADPNPWFKHASVIALPALKEFPGENYSVGPYGSKGKFDPVNNTDSDHIKYGNAVCHQEEGQNVLFLDGHVNFEKNSFCGVGQDNIYTTNNGSDPRLGNPYSNETTTGRAPLDRNDGFLVGNRAAPDSPGS